MTDDLLTPEEHAMFAAMTQAEEREAAEQARAQAVAALDGIRQPGDIGSFTQAEHDALRLAAPDAYRAMAERVGPYAPAAWLEAQGRSQLLAPESVGLLRALTAHPMSDTDVVAAVSAAGAGALDGDTLRRLNDSQSAWLKRDHKALYWRSARQLADSVGEVVAHVQ